MWLVLLLTPLLSLVLPVDALSKVSSAASGNKCAFVVAVDAACLPGPLVPVNGPSETACGIAHCSWRALCDFYLC